MYQIFGWIRVRLKELMPLSTLPVAKQILANVLSDITFCSPKIHDFLFMVYNVYMYTTTSKIWRANFTEHQCVILFISVEEWKEGHTKLV